MMFRGLSMPEALIGPFGREDLAAYAAASGDDNPLHLDAAVALKAGFCAPPVHGMALMAAIEPALRQWSPNLAIVRMNAQFVEPLLVGQSARLSARVVKSEQRDGAQQEALLRIRVQGPGRAPCLVGEVLVLAQEKREDGHA